MENNNFKSKLVEYVCDNKYILTNRVKQTRVIPWVGNHLLNRSSIILRKIFASGTIVLPKAQHRGKHR